MEIFYHNNSSVLAVAGTVSILVDGLYEDKTYFDEQGIDNYTAIIEGREPYDKIDLMLFTHCHNDHFCWDKIAAFTENNKDVKIVFPEDGNDCDYKQYNSVNVIDGDKGTICAGGNVEVSFFRTGHTAGEKLGGNEHVCYMISTEEENLLITADFDVRSLDSLMEWCPRVPDYIIANPLIMKGDAMDRIRAKWPEINFIVYHIPTEENDILMYRKIAVSDAIKLMTDRHFKILLQSDKWVELNKEEV